MEYGDICNLHKNDIEYSDIGNLHRIYDSRDSVLFFMACSLVSLFCSTCCNLY